MSSGGVVGVQHVKALISVCAGARSGARMQELCGQI
jgi:hypothetical protein